MSMVGPTGFWPTAFVALVTAGMTGGAAQWWGQRHQNDKVDAEAQLSIADAATRVVQVQDSSYDRLLAEIARMHLDLAQSRQDAEQARKEAAVARVSQQRAIDAYADMGRKFDGLNRHVDRLEGLMRGSGLPVPDRPNISY